MFQIVDLLQKFQYLLTASQIMQLSSHALNRPLVFPETSILYISHHYSILAFSSDKRSREKNPKKSTQQKMTYLQILFSALRLKLVSNQSFTVPILYRPFLLRAKFYFTRQLSLTPLAEKSGINMQQRNLDEGSFSQHGEKSLNI